MLMPSTASLRVLLEGASLKLTRPSPEMALRQGCRVCSSSQRAEIWALRTRMMASFLFRASPRAGSIVDSIKVRGLWLTSCLPSPFAFCTKARTCSRQAVPVYVLWTPQGT